MAAHGGNGTTTEGASPDEAPRTDGRKTVTDPLIGQTLDSRYKIERVLGEGGMGLVYKAVHTTLGKPLAIKVLRPEVSKNEEIVARFRQEAQSASGIGNQHIIDISDFGTLNDGSTYFVMEFLTGRSLTQAISNENFTVERTVHVVRQLTNALGAAHEVGIVHRDMKPDNVQLVERGSEKDFVKVLDFGIAKVGGSTSKLTQAGQVFGTPHYMSPEQCAGTNVDQRTDIYAVGVILYEMATGKVPFDADNLMGILTKHLYENPIAPHDLPPPVNVPPALEAVIMKCLEKKAENRYQTMAELGTDLDAIERGITPQAVIHRVDRGSSTSGSGQTLTGVEARVSVGMGQTDLAIRKNRTPMLIGAGLLATLLIGGVAMLSGSDEPASPNVVKPATAPVAQPIPQAEPEPAPPPATISITSVPPKVEVYRDGALVGNTPYTLDKPAGTGTVNLELRAIGYEHKALAVSAMSSDTVVVTLSKKVEKVEKVETRRPSTATRPKAPRKAEPAAKPVDTKPKAPSRGGTEVLDPWN